MSSLAVYVVRNPDSGHVHSMYTEEPEAWLCCTEMPGGYWVYNTTVTLGELVDNAEAWNAHVRESGLRMKPREP